MYYVIAGLVVASVIIFDVTAEVEPRPWTRDRSQSKATVYAVTAEKSAVALSDMPKEAPPMRKTGAHGG